MAGRLEVEEVLALAWLAAGAERVPPETAAAVIVLALEKAGYKIVPIATAESRECRAATKPT